MIRHIALLTLDEAAGPAELDALQSALRELPSIISEIRSYSVGTDLGIAEGNATVAVIAEFDDVAAYRVYADHPDHVSAIKSKIAPYLTARSVIQTEL